jgi:hypothetical protein
MQEVLQCLGVNKICTTPFQPQSKGMVEQYIKTVNKHMWKVVALHQGDWGTRLPIFLLAHRVSTHDSTGLTPSNLVLGRELCLSCDLLFGTSPDREQPTINSMADLVDRLHNIHKYAYQHLMLASDGMKTPYNRLAYCAGYHEEDKEWLYRPTRTKGKSPQLHSPWQGPCRVVTQTNDVVYKIKSNPTSRMMLVYLGHLAPYQGTTWDEQPRGGSSS